MNKVNHIKPPKNMPYFQRKQIQCPKCGIRVIDVALTTVIEVRTISERTSSPVDYYIKCKKCNTELGLRKLG